MKNRKKKKKESGQALVEFALVLPIFMLLVMGILDFGFLFYNYISMENAARNAARVACVEYQHVVYDFEAPGGGARLASPRIITLPNSDATKASSYATSVTGEGGVQTPTENGFSVSPSNVAITPEEIEICVQVAESLQRTGIVAEGRKVTIDYSYDSEASDTNVEGWSISERYKGDVTVTVQGEAHVLTPVLGVVSDNMKKTLTSKSTFKVEQQYAAD